MAYILGAIISSTLIYILFNLAKNYKSNINYIILFNYLVATLLGIFLFTRNNQFSGNFSAHQIYSALALGTFFIVMFFLIGISSQKSGITITTLANKLSLVFPVLFSLIYFSEKLSIIQFSGIILAFASIVLTIFKKQNIKQKQALFLLPLFIFIGSGISDSFVKFIQEVVIQTHSSGIFSTQVFFVAFIYALIVTFTKKTKSNFRKVDVLFGTLLGIVNFGSLYFLIQALNSSLFESSLVFTIVNISIVVCSTLAGLFFFKEKLSKINYIGIVLALISLYFLM